MTKEKVRQYLLSNIGRVLESHEIQAAADGAAQYSRRLRELRDEEGWPILTHNDDATLKPGQYLLRDKPPDKTPTHFARNISARRRAEVLDRNELTCQMCGLAPGDIDPATNRKAQFHIGHIKDKSLGGKDELSNLRTLCFTCNQGAKKLTPERASKNWLLAQVQRSGIDEQKAVYEWLKKKFAGKSTP